ncbi:MAG TPA: helix-turn-helix domain-containing protein [Syntrophobacteraceae bacterium]|nr:helix-turn-helix domain-containing protein [Syntrophobacteraceae bacterium]
MKDDGILRLAGCIKDIIEQFDLKLADIAERLTRIEAALNQQNVIRMPPTEEPLRIQRPLKEDSWVSTKEAAGILSVAAHTLYNDRSLHRRFLYSKVGGLIRYKVGDLLKFMEQHKVGGGEKTRRQ